MFPSKSRLLGAGKSCYQNEGRRGNVAKLVDLREKGKRKEIGVVLLWSVDKSSSSKMDGGGDSPRKRNLKVLYDRDDASTCREKSSHF